MIHWLWLLPAIFLSASAGLVLCALAVSARGKDEIQNLTDGQFGCVCQHEAVCSKQADAR